MVNERLKVLPLVICSIVALLGGALTGCASLWEKDVVLAVVDGEPVTEDDLAYELNIAHRREDLSEGKTLNIDEYVRDLIDDRLIVMEARRTGIDQKPGIQQKIRSWITTESVRRLHEEEIVQKSSVSEGEIKDYFRKNFESFTLGLIGADSEKEAAELLEKLKDGSDFREIAMQYSSHQSKEQEGEVVYFRFQLSQSPVFEKTVLSLQAGEISDVIPIDNTYYIIKFIKREDAFEEDFDKLKGRIRASLKKEKQKLREEEVLKQLREQADVTIDQEILSSIQLDGKENMEKWSKDTRPLVTMYDLVYTVSEFVGSAKIAKKRSPDTFSKEAVIDNWIDYKLVDHEALSRQYEKRADFRTALNRYTDTLIKNAFVRTVIAQNVTVTKDDEKDYYEKHRDSFMNPARYKMQQIIVQTEDEAREIREVLMAGTDFDWLSSRRSTISAQKMKTEKKWKEKLQLPVYFQDVVDTLKPGEFSPVLETDDAQYAVIQVLAKEEASVQDYDSVKQSVFEQAFREKAQELLTSYIDQLKQDAEIDIREEAIQSLREKLEKKVD